MVANIVSINQTFTSIFWDYFSKSSRKIIYISITQTMKVKMCFMVHEIVSLFLSCSLSPLLPWVASLCVESFGCSHFVGQININSGCTLPVTIETVGNIKLQNSKLETNKSKYIHKHRAAAAATAIHRKHEWQKTNHRTRRDNMWNCSSLDVKFHLDERTNERENKKW